ncbi:arginase [Carbonactinospora thermoautotrophica]|uniref:arginase family protein n=1 Tax=Carbonactinospora thermoautotrophica TaxID=1469144 RepID=UPI002271F0FE|nr:arginase family protein [Carbonactinospora thermoautotrophica]MCX9190914.1 arginase [Carbonactinospora thermoautotrophica]
MTVVLVPYHLDEYFPDLDVPVVPTSVITPPLPDGTPWERMAYLYEYVADAVRRGCRDGCPVVASGDCTTALGTVAGLQRAGLDPAVVWFDGHGDLHTPESSRSGYLGGMPLRMLAGAGDPTVAERIGLWPVSEERMVLVDARDLDPPEKVYLAGSGIRRCPVQGLAEDVLPDGAVYLHLDFDVVDPADLSGLRFPAPGGPRLAQVLAAALQVVRTGRVAAVGLACTWHPGRGVGARARALTDPVLAALGRAT